MLVMDMTEVFRFHFHDSRLSNVPVCWIFFYSIYALDMFALLVKTELVLVVLYKSSVLITAPAVR
jgi:hypothetical protein